MDFIVVGGRGAVVVWLVVWPDEPWELRCDDELCELLCEDELWLELLDFGPAGTAASPVATMAMDNDQANVFSIVIPPRIRMAEG